MGAKPIKEVAARLGGWPVIVGDAWDQENTWTWQETVKKFRRLGFSMDYIVDFSIGVDLKNSTKRIIDVSLNAHTDIHANRVDFIHNVGSEIDP